MVCENLRKLHYAQNMYFEGSFKKTITNTSHNSRIIIIITLCARDEVLVDGRRFMGN